MDKIRETILKLREAFLEAAAEMDESAAYVHFYKTILAIGQGYSLLKISSALKDDRDLFSWFRRAYIRADKILYSDYLDSKNA